ncbi:N-acetylglucosaminyltransferase [Stenotrophomonas maltophilia]|uniref:GlcNAc-transferase family protein n=1 Tax=Stenotrophomonas maltophilia TaxID=40324 RepID=UPI000810B873|nr:GlcNAc-transferase family protein [Stenotrophomonas maltophilia]OCK45846.1 N-acetylglucosaminyltransferase [Stenotrophomonas maltophilia]
MDLPASLFVQIPSYRDPQLIPTLVDLVRRAAAPAALHVVVCWQHGDEANLQDFLAAGFQLESSCIGDQHPIHRLRLNGAEVELIEVGFMHARGCGWARRLAQERYRDERYNLQIDSHHRFSDAWDGLLVEMLESLRTRSCKPLLTGYPPAFQPESYPETRQNHVGQMLVRGFNSVGVVSYKAVRMPQVPVRSKPMRARFISGGFLFSDGEFVREVMNDADHFFSTEEIVMAVRAYTHGYDFFHPHRPLLWHQYNSDANRVWDDHSDECRSRGEIEASAFDRSLKASGKAVNMLAAAASGDAFALARHGLGGKRTLQQYERYAGLSFAHRGVHEDATRATEPDNAHFTTDEQHWLDKLICRRVFQVQVKRLDAEIAAAADLESLVLTAQAGDGTIVGRRQLSPEDLQQLITRGEYVCIDHFSSCPSRLPTCYQMQIGGNSQDDANRFQVVVREIEEDLMA